MAFADLENAPECFESKSGLHRRADQQGERKKQTRKPWEMVGVAASQVPNSPESPEGAGPSGSRLLLAWCKPTQAPAAEKLERKFPGRARPWEGRRPACSPRGSQVPCFQPAFPLRALGRPGRLAGKQGSIACWQPERQPPNLEEEDAASGRGGAGRGGALSAPTALLPGLWPGKRAEAERAGSGFSAGTAPALPARAASATVPASPPRHGAMVRGARTPRTGL
ncbi:uncharacterized protein LOC117070999 [Trachypithecus francoisi]|uniref:uncharacterized protein LOC117070999 n=1 Tax=Trachypithecus francoisi TaxID=54180 RepID=UPI00141B4C08|nr:uncharacterized protein LOC117070999 [Trachypithecus francoisi]